MKGALSSTVRRLLPATVRRWLVRQTRWPRIGRIRPEDLRRIEPLSRVWGGDRGRPIDRQFIERFLVAHSGDIHGCVLEFGDGTYARRFGGSRIDEMDIADVTPENPDATLIFNLATGANMPEARFDCIICTQTLQLVTDPVTAVRCLQRALRPGGVLLVTVPGISQVVQDERNPWLDYWRYTAAGLEQLLKGAFSAGSIQIHTYGNVFAAVAFLHGMAAEELTADELDHMDAAYPLIVAARARA